MSESFSGVPAPAMRGPSAAEIVGWLHALSLPSPAVDDASRIDRIVAMEQVKSALSAAQARETVDFKRSQLLAQRESGVSRADLGKGISAQVALARRESPHRGGRLVGLAEALVNEMPHTLAALTEGTISEWRATLMARETACLSKEDRTRVDARLAGRLDRLSDRQVFVQARKHAYELDPHSVVARSQRAAADRRVTIRPAPDTMAIVSAHLPVAQGVAVYAALCREADSRRSQGDERGRGQLMADMLVERVSGQSQADQVPVEVQLVMTEETLLRGGDAPARLEGYGPVPAPFARAFIRGLDDDTHVWLRRLFTDPVSGRLTAMESTRRAFAGTLRKALIVRDEVCRTPWCGAPIRHGDHVVPVKAGGATEEANGQGLCEACNHAKQAPGWSSVPGDGGSGDSVTVATPTGHRYFSIPPPLPGAPPPSGSPPLPGTSQLPRVDVWYRHPFELRYAA